MTLGTADKEYQEAVDELVNRINKGRPRVALYARVSTDDKEQNPETQLYALRQFCEDAGWEIYQEYADQARAKDYRRRTAWRQLQKDARQRKFKCVMVVHLDRAFRSVKECVNCLEDWQERGITFKSVRQDVIDTTTGMGRFVLHVLAAAAELESSLISERVSAGIRRAKAEGKNIGKVGYRIPFTNVCNALFSVFLEKQEINYNAASKILSKREKRKISPGFIHIRITREAERRGMARDDLLKEILANGNR